MKYLFERDTLFATLMVFIGIWLFSHLPFNTHILDPIRLALHDFDYNDIAYSRLHKGENTKMDTSITIIDIGRADRGVIADVVTTLRAYQPKAIGIDLTFDGDKDSLLDAKLGEAIKNTPNLVLAEEIIIEREPHKAPSKFLDIAPHRGFANLGEEKGGVVRAFHPVDKADHNKKLHFSVATATISDPEKANAFLRRDHEAEIINYSRKEHQYLNLNYADLLEGTVDSSKLRNKTVLIGFVGTPNDLEDKQFTPMNPKFAGKTIPDMPGVVVNANIISMIHEGNFINSLPTWVEFLIAFLLTWVHMAFFISYYIERHIWFHLAAKVAQLLSAVLFVYIGLYCFFYLSWKIDLTLTLAGIILAVDILYFYEALARWLHKRFKYPTVFPTRH